MKLRLDPTRSYALALEGGGARGAYQIGAWKALTEAGIHLSAVAGTSVGALNGALITMGDIPKAEEIWSTIHYSEVMDVDDEEMGDLLRGDLRELDLRHVMDRVAAVVHNRGLDVTPLRNWIRQLVDPAVIRAAKQELYIVTFSVSDQKELELRARDLDDSTLHDMLLASAYLPAFRAERMEGKLYADGGLRDVLPLHVLIENGCTDIIAMRLYGPGIMRPVRIPEGTQVHTIAPRDKDELGGILEFEAEQSKKNLLLGYYDAMRFLYGLKGERYYLDAQWTEEQARQFLCQAVSRAEPELTLRAIHEKRLPALAKRLKAEGESYTDLAAALLEAAAERREADRWRIYTEDELLAAAGETVFYDIYTDEEKAADPAKEDTGLFFKDEPGAGFTTGTDLLIDGGVIASMRAGKFALADGNRKREKP